MHISPYCKPCWAKAANKPKLCGRNWRWTLDIWPGNLIDERLKHLRVVHPRDIRPDDNAHAGVLLVDDRNSPYLVLLHLLFTGPQRIVRKARNRVLGEAVGNMCAMGSLPAAVAEMHRSRSVMIPTSRFETRWETTGMAPTSCSRIICATCCTVSEGLQQTGCFVIMKVVLL